MSARWQVCKGCGRRIVFEDDLLRVSHEAPVCEWFQDLVQQAGKPHVEVLVQDERGELVAPRTKA